jgi:hypothetical protein
MRGKLRKHQRLLCIALICAGILSACSTIYLFSGTRNTSSDIAYTLHVDGEEQTRNIAVIIPGQNESPALSQYQTIGRYYQQAGIAPLWVEFNWKTLTLKNFTEASRLILTDLTQQYPDAEIHLFGFSLGAVIAFKMSEMSGFPTTVLCSLSPAFQEDIRSHPFPLRFMMKQFGNYPDNGLVLSPATKGKTLVFLYAERDSRLISENIIIARTSIYPESRIIIVKDAKHDLSGQAYLDTIGDIIDEIYN